MDLESLNGQVEMFMKATTQKMNETAMVKCIGQTDLFTKENGSEVSSMGKVK